MLVGIRRLFSRIMTESLSYNLVYQRETVPRSISKFYICDARMKSITQSTFGIDSSLK